MDSTSDLPPRVLRHRKRSPPHTKILHQLRGLPSQPLQFFGNDAPLTMAITAATHTAGSSMTGLIGVSTAGGTVNNV